MNWKPLLIVPVVVGLFAAPSKSPQKPGISVVRVPHDGIQPQAVWDRSGVLHLLYFAGDPKAGDLFYTKSRDGGVTWSTPLRVNSEAGSAIAVGTIRGGQMAIGRNGRVHIAWNGSSAVQATGPLNPEAGQRGAPMLYSRLNDDGTAFEPERSLMTHTFGLDGGGTVAADSAGNVYVAWHGKTAGAAKGESGREVWVAASHNDGASFTGEQPAWKEPTGACGCCGMAMFADSRGTVRALYRSATENVHRDVFLLTSVNQGRSFHGRKLDTWNINACPMSSMAFGEGGGRVWGAWETGGQVLLENLAASNATPVPAPGDGKGRKHPRVAIARDGEVLLVWTEGTGWQRGGSLAWQLFDVDGNAVGERHSQAGVPAWSFGAAVAGPAGFVILY